MQEKHCNKQEEKRAWLRRESEGEKPQPTEVLGLLLTRASGAGYRSHRWTRLSPSPSGSGTVIVVWLARMRPSSV